MAIQDIATELNRLIDSKPAYNSVKAALAKIHKGWDGRFYELTLSRFEIANNLSKAWEQAVSKNIDKGYIYDIQDEIPECFGTKAFRKAVDEVVSRFGTNTNQYGRSMFGCSEQWAKGEIFRIKQASGLTFFIVKKRNLYRVGERFRKEIFNSWRKETIAKAKAHKTLVGGEIDPKKTDALKNINVPGTKTPVVHSGDTTAFVDWLEVKGNMIGGTLNINVKDFDLAQEIVNALGVDFQEDTWLKKHGYKQTRVVRAALGPANIGEKYDAKGRKSMLKALWSIDKGIKLGKWQYLNKEQAAKVTASTPFSTQVSQAAQHELVKAILNQNKGKKGIKIKVKGKTKKPKNSKRKGVLRKSRAAGKGKSTKLKIAQKIIIARQLQRKEKGSKEKTTGNADSLIKTRSYIQRRLPAETRRNMGRPALQNRTGRFSNSVQLLSLTEGQNSVVAKYTYLLNPYATFENAGKSKWPLAYNPKQLIAKSIRNLAMGRIEQKLTLRRV